MGRLIEERRALLPLLGLLIILAGAGATALMLAAGITLSLSRGAWFGAAVGFLVMMLLAGRRWMIAALIATGLLVATLALGGAGVLPKTIQERIGSVGSSLILLDYYKVPITPENFAVKERMAYWFGGIHMAEDHPWQGVGLGNYGAQYDAKYFTSPFMTLAGPRAQLLHPHHGGDGRDRAGGVPAADRRRAGDGHRRGAADGARSRSPVPSPSAASGSSSRWRCIISSRTCTSSASASISAPSGRSSRRFGPVRAMPLLPHRPRKAATLGDSDHPSADRETRRT